MSSGPDSPPLHRARKDVASRWTHARPDAPLVSTMPHNSFAGEQYRNLATQVEEYVTANNLERPVLVVTSADPGSGKTVTSLNLAISLSRRGERNVLLIEGDLLKPSFDAYLQRDQSAPGLSDLLASETTVHARSVLASMWNAGIDVMFAGSRRDIADLVTASRIDSLLDELRAHYDLIVVDSPPFVLSVGRALLASADAALVVVRAGKSVDRSVEEALSIIGPNKTLGLVLNDVSMNALRYGAYGAGSYGSYGAYGAYAAYEAYEKKDSSRLTAASAEVEHPERPRRSPDTEARRRRLRGPLLRAALIAGLLAAVVGLGYWMGIGRGGSPTSGPESAEPGAAATRESRPEVGQATTTEPGAPEAVEQSTTDSPNEPEPATASGPPPREPNLSRVTFTMIGSAGGRTLLTRTPLNLRQQPSTDAPASSVLPPGLEVEVQEHAGNWRRVSTAAGEGWVWAGGLVDLQALSEAESSPTHRTRARVNLRGGPGLGQPIVVTLPASLPVSANQIDGDWVGVTTSFGEGWVNRGWLEEIEPIAEQRGGRAATTEPVAPGSVELSAADSPNEPQPTDTSAATTAEPSPSGATLTVIGRADSPTLLTRTHLNLRQEPSTDAPLWSVLPPGLEVEVRESSGNWRRVSTAAGEGWVWRGGLVDSHTLLQADPSTTHRTTSRVNMRSGPGLEEAIVLTLPGRLPVTATQIDDGWARVTTSFGEGWISRGWLEEIEPAGEQTGGQP